ncbi:MAG: MBL fold metallo-hydrolase, partial [Bacilli bacterium]
IQMLLNTNRPMELKQRILSDHGHLCNEESAFIAAMIVGHKTSEIILAHLSEEANSPELALEIYQKIFQQLRIDMTRLKIKTAWQWKSLRGGCDEN